MIASTSLSIIPESLAKETVVMAIDDTTIRYISISIGYAMWTPKNTKLELAIELLSEIIPMLKDKQVILCFDSWYAKKKRACEIFSVNKSPMAIKQYFLSTSFLDSTALRFIPRSA